MKNFEIGDLVQYVPYWKLDFYIEHLGLVLDVKPHLIRVYSFVNHKTELWETSLVQPVE